MPMPKAKAVTMTVITFHEPEEDHRTDDPQGGKHHWRRTKSRDEPPCQQQEDHEGDRQRDGRGFQLRHAESGQHGFKHHEVSSDVDLSKSIEVCVKTILAFHTIDHGDEGGHDAA